MTKWLASIQSLSEAKAIQSLLPDILDMKNPTTGALGAMNVSEVAEVVKLIKQRCQTSATTGDLPMQAPLLADAIQTMAATGVDYVKIGIFPDNNLQDCIRELAPTIGKMSMPVIAVMFADNYPQQNLIPQLSQAGFYGVMVDTAFKNGKTLRDHWSTDDIAAFVQHVKQHNLLCGLAGALKQQDIAVLSEFEADYLGFRSALCAQQDRTTNISLEAVKQVQQAVRECRALVA